METVHSSRPNAHARPVTAPLLGGCCARLAPEHKKKFGLTSDVVASWPKCFLLVDRRTLRGRRVRLCALCDCLWVVLLLVLVICPVWWLLPQHFVDATIYLFVCEGSW